MLVFVAACSARRLPALVLILVPPALRASALIVEARLFGRCRPFVKLHTPFARPLLFLWTHAACF